MYSQRLAVVYADGTQTEVTVTQWAFAQWAAYASGKGFKFDLSNVAADPLALLMIRYQAYAQLHRDPGTPRPKFEVWDVTVDDVSPVGEAQPADPTETAT